MLIGENILSAYKNDMTGPILARRVYAAFLFNYLLPLLSTTHTKDFKWLIKRTKLQNQGRSNERK